MEKGKYPLEWLDLLVMVSLNPAKTDVSAITQEQAEQIKSRLSEETLRLQSLIKSQVFSINKEDEIDLLIKQYHVSLIALLDQTVRNKELTAPEAKPMQELNRALLSNLDELFSFLETRFSKYISLDERLPVTYFDVTKRELKIKIDRLQKCVLDNPVAKLLVNKMTNFITSPSHPYDLTFRVVLYFRELINGLEKIDWTQNDNEEFSQLEHLLIYLNFNSKKFMNLLTDRLATEVNRYEQPVEKMDKLLYFYKAFNQLHRKPNMKLNPKYRDLDTVIGNWFSQEIVYLEKKLRLVVLPLQGIAGSSNGIEQTLKQKILCVLSTDQMALILRATDDLRIIQAKSLNEVFKTIAPHLSTPYKEDISHGAMRSKAYSPEERDRQIAIETLERIIEKIKEY
ncbi:hypothetical protein [Sphingobacterium thalpophilum]|uniref:Uncharacterized protein n=1 Tax=Sphingobacterium thalpophilum TaxID=259 RepID=A0A4U9UAA6_9SPHI|nr:hypothetical protein [Sphingobacterium thalpophilum]VTR29483.1 Uncharacterised protein [Sphingobacterium thalpophilum]